MCCVDDVCECHVGVVVDMADNVFAAFSFSAPAGSKILAGRQQQQQPRKLKKQEEPQEYDDDEYVKEEYDDDDDVKPRAAIATTREPPAGTEKRRKVSVKKESCDPGGSGEGASGAIKIKAELEIEDVGQIAARKSVKMESPSSKAMKVVQFQIKAGGGLKGAQQEAAPVNWEKIIEEIRSMRIDRDAPVDLFGTHQLLDVEADKETQRFHALVAAMISSQTRDAVTGAAMQRLRAMPGGLTVAQVASDAVEVDALAEVLKPVGFYRQKAKFMKSIAEILLRPPHNGSVPSSLDDLMKLPGVGPKVALLVLWVAFDMGEEGLIVDTNVRRVCSRLGWVPPDATPELTRRTLESWLPRTLWADISFLFVGFGQQMCKPMAPKCESCTVSHLCPSAFKPSPKKPTRKPKNAAVET